MNPKFERKGIFFNKVIFLIDRKEFRKNFFFFDEKKLPLRLKENFLIDRKEFRYNNKALKI